MSAGAVELHAIDRAQQEREPRVRAQAQIAAHFLELVLREKSFLRYAVWRDGTMPMLPSSVVEEARMKICGLSMRNV